MDSMDLEFLQESLWGWRCVKGKKQFKTEESLESYEEISQGSGNLSEHLTGKT